ncbi:uncharacterized protein LAJ45_07126 [Morchella importuna]|nr:uncharacterized protein LAJ45_07126 [Morchella importuna]KAH8148783.1 hypothetical protein LAJ45_07126 [Morchella importuna]
MSQEDINDLIDREPIRESDFHPDAPWNQLITDSEVEESLANGMNDYEDNEENGEYENDDEYDGDVEKEDDEGDEGKESGKGGVGGKSGVSGRGGVSADQDDIDDPFAPWNK